MSLRQALKRSLEQSQKAEAIDPTSEKGSKDTTTSSTASPKPKKRRKSSKPSTTKKKSSTKTKTKTKKKASTAKKKKKKKKKKAVSPVFRLGAINRLGGGKRPHFEYESDDDDE